MPRHGDKVNVVEVAPERILPPNEPRRVLLSASIDMVIATLRRPLLFATTGNENLDRDDDSAI